MDPCYTPDISLGLGGWPVKIVPMCTMYMLTFKVKRIPGSGKFVNQELETFAIKQGKLGDCWLLSSVAALLSKPKLMKRVVMYPYNVMPDARQCGIFRFRFYHLGEWIDILIDDILPTKNAAIAVKNEYWMLLLEKAYAKFLGSYDALAGGDPCWALCNLTGGIVLDFKKSFNLDGYRFGAIEIRMSQLNPFSIMSC